MVSGGAVLTAWALHLGGGPLAVGVLGSLTYFAQLVQFPSAWLTARLGGRKVALWAVALSRQALWPLVVLPFLPIGADAKRTVLVAVSAVSALLAIVGGNGWTTWMGDLVPGSIRGRYFGRRTAFCTITGAAANLGAGVWLDFSRGRGFEAWALSGLGLVAVGVGALSTWLMAQQHDPGHHSEREVPWRAMWAPLREAPMRRLLAYIVPWNFGVGLSSSLFAIFMLHELHMGYAAMAVREIAAAVIRMLCSPLWGRAIDRVGARPVLVACSCLIVGIPFIWFLPTADNLWPVFGDSLAAGILWSGQALAVQQLPIAISPSRGRSWHVAAFYAAAGLAFALAAVAGGHLGDVLPERVAIGSASLSRFQAVLALSAGFRVVGALLCMRTLEPGAKPVRELATMMGESTNAALAKARRSVDPASE